MFNINITNIFLIQYLLNSLAMNLSYHPENAALFATQLSHYNDVPPANKK